MKDVWNISGKIQAIKSASLMKKRMMGCVSTRPQENQRIFRVINVDTSGRHLRRGRLEVTDTQLIFYQQNGSVVIRWPLTCLRRYGFDSEIFSFECGRRCATGSGVYGFKCRKAEALFTFLQESINQPSTESNGIQPEESGYLEPITRTSNNGTVSPGGYVCIHESTHLSSWSSGLSRCCSSAAHHYVNEEVNANGVNPVGRCSDSVDINTNYTKLDDLLKQEQSTKRQHFYVNVKPDSVELLNSEQQEQVNYAELDLDRNESLTTTPTKSPEGYAQIDFDKTVALSNSTNPCPSFNDDSMRKTRHNAVMDGAIQTANKL